MAKSPIHFGTDGWRAVIAEQFTFDNVEIVTRAIAQYVVNRFGTEKPIIIGYDLRFLAPQFAQHAAKILTQYGINVEMADTWHPTPVIALAALQHNSAGAMMFTASHNPPEYLGIKFIPEYAGPAMPEITDPIVANVRAFEANPDSIVPPSNVAKQGEIKTIYPRAEYITYLKRFVNFDVLKTATNLKVLYDPIYGVGQGYIDTLLAEAGVQVSTMRTGSDPLFGGVMPEPKEEYLQELMHRVKTEGFDLGLSSDGDADRFGLVDETGRFLIANDVVPMMFRHLYKNKGYRGSVVRSLATSKLLDRLAEVYGNVPVIETPVGFKWIGKAMRDNAVIIGGEESGGFSILGYIPEKDGVLANLLLVEMLATEKKPLSQIYNDMIAEAGMRFYGLAENFHLSEADKKETVERLKELSVGQQFGALTVTETDHRDGVKLYFGPYEWIVVRPSGTEPVLRLYLEATSEEKLALIETAFRLFSSVSPTPVHA